MKKTSEDEISEYINEYNITHFKKVNLFGSSKVGKKTLISYIEHFSNKEIEFKFQKNEEKEKNKDTKDKEEEVCAFLVEEVKKITIKYYETKKLDINLYITNTDNTELIEENLNTLLSKSECIILMIDITSTDSFTQISELIPLIYEKMKANIEYGDIPIFFISNKLDLDEKRVVSGFEIKELIDNYTGISNHEITLNLEPNANDETINDFIIKLCHTISEAEKQYTFKYDSLNLVKICEPMLLNKDNNLMKNIDNTINLLLLGSQSVGKTSFSNKLFKNAFKENQIATIGIGIDITVVELYGCLVKIELWDTAGQERFKSIPAKYYSKCDGFLLLYDVNDRTSFDDISGWIKDIRKARGNNEDNYEKKSNDEILILIGNKIDIGKRKVTIDEAIAFANKFNVQYYETSCKLGINLYEILCDIIMQVSSLNRRESTSFALEKRKEHVKTLNNKKKCC